MALNPGTVRHSASIDDHAVSRRGDVHAHGTEIFSHDSDTVRFFNLQFGGIPNDGLTFSKGGHDSDDRQFVDKGWNNITFNDGSMQ